MLGVRILTATTEASCIGCRRASHVYDACTLLSPVASIVLGPLGHSYCQLGVNFDCTHWPGHWRSKLFWLLCSSVGLLILSTA